jgi:hypothetical protein
MPPVNAFEETLSYISTAELYYNTWKADKLRNEKMWANSEFLLAGQHIYLMFGWSTHLPHISETRYTV